jgi:hypothetical protein
MERIVLLFCAIFFASAQGQTYRCATSTFCDSQDYPRVDEMGCIYYCYLDRADLGSIDCPDFHFRYLQWKGTAAECNQQCYLDAHRVIIPNACESELRASYSMLSALDSDPSSISGNDIELWCGQVKSGDPGNRITPDNFRNWWYFYYAEVVDPSCPTH